MSTAQLPGPPCDVVVWSAAESVTAAAVAAQLLLQGVEVRRVLRDEATAVGGDLTFVSVCGRLLVEPRAADVAQLLERRTHGRASEKGCVPDGRSGTAQLVDLAGAEHRVVVVDRPAGCLCACVVSGRLLVSAGSAPASALRALAVQVFAGGGSPGPDGLDRLRVKMLASSAREADRLTGDARGEHTRFGL